MFKLQKGVKMAWVQALRSGEYKQCRGQYRTLDTDFQPVSYCCLGVLNSLEGSFDCGPSDFLHNDSLNNFKALVHMNDGTNGVKQHSFDEIADYIEEKL